MLNALRRSARTWVAKLLIGLLVISFAIWGVSDFVGGIGGNAVAEAGDTPVEAVDFQLAYQRRIQDLSQQLGRGITPSQAEALGVPSQVLSSLVTDALLLDEADALSVGVSDEALAEAVRSTAAFEGPDGAFDRFTFERVLAASGFTEESYLEAERESLLRRQVVDGVIGGLRAPEAYLRAVNAFRNEERTVVALRVGREAVGPIADPTSTELTSFFQDNRDRFQAPEYREIAILRLTPEAIAEPATVPDEEVRAEYDRSGAFGMPERRRVMQIVFEEGTAAAAALDRIEDGEPFADVVAGLDRSMPDVDLGLVERGDIVDPVVREAAFAMPAGQSRLVDGRFGPVLVRVAAVEAARKVPFEEVAPEIRREIAADRAAREVVDLYDLIEDAFAGGSTVREVGERFDLPVETVTVSREGRTPGGEAAEVPAAGELLPEAFDADVGIENAPIRLGRDGWAWFRVTDVIPERDRELSEVEAEVIAAWTEDRIAERIAARAGEGADRLRAGEAAEAIAADLIGVAASERGPFTRGAPDGAGDLPAAAVEAAFSGPEGHVADVAAGGGERVVLRVASVTPPVFFAEDADLVPLAEQLNRSLGDTLLTEYVNTLQSEKGVRVNQALVDQIVGSDR